MAQHHKTQSHAMVRQRDQATKGLTNNQNPGRNTAQEVTIFDGTGVGLQDLAVAAVEQKLAKQQSLGHEFG